MVETAPARWEGYAYGYAVGSPGDELTVTCYVKVNGALAATTPTGSGTTVAGTHGPVTWAQGPLDSHVVCERVTRNGVLDRDDCYHVDNTQVPPQAVWDLLLETEPTWSDTVLCPALASLAGSYGPVTVNAQGDVFVAGEPQWDCPPYDIEWP